MRLRFALLVLLIIGAGCSGDGQRDKATASVDRPSPCAKAVGPDSAGVPEVQPAALEAHLRILGDDSLQGRGTGTKAYAQAADYIAGCFADLGLEPAGTQGYLQPVPLIRARTAEGTTLVLHQPAGSRELELNRDFLPAPDLLRPTVEVTAPLVLVGFGVTAPDREYDDYRGVDAKGKIVVLLTGAPKSFPPTARAHYATTRVKHKNAVDHGAVGALIVRTRATKVSPGNGWLGRCARWATCAGSIQAVRPEMCSRSSWNRWTVGGGKRRFVRGSSEVVIRGSGPGRGRYAANV